jgi:hypothetical protein
MKTRIFTLIIIFSFYTMYSFATIYDVTIGFTTNVSCTIGDTLQFYGGWGGNSVTINGATVLTNSTSGYIGQYVIIGGETTFCVNNGEGPWCGSINILPTEIINNYIANSAIKIYPNPVQDKVNISLQQNSKAAIIKIYNIFGAIVREVLINKSVMTISLSELTNGLYFYQLTDESKNIMDNGKLIKEK